MSAGSAVGSEIDGYRVDAVLHAGGNGVVYRVMPTTAPDPGFPLVMKVPAMGPGQPPLALVAFETEATIMQHLTGPYVPRFVAAGDIARIAYLVMEWIDGESVASIVKRAPLAPDEVARLGAALADAVQSIHLQSVQHLDIKPDNFIVRPTGEAVLLDFGYARHALYPDLLAEEQHFAAGSAAYVSPEQVNGWRGDLRSDLFSLGAMIYELAIGEPPFGDPATYAGWRDRLWRAPVPPRALRPDIPPWLQEVVLHLLEVDVGRRYATAAHLAFDLRHPEQVPVTERGTRVQRVGFVGQVARWWQLRHASPASRAAARIRAQVILAGVDTEHPDDDRLPALQAAVRQLIAAAAEYRFICVAVIGAAPVGEGAGPMDTASGRHREHAIRLRHWAEPLELPPVRQSLHVVESADAAATLLEFAHVNHVDVIVLGAPRPGDRTLGWWRSTASRVAAQARCSVYLTRVP